MYRKKDKELRSSVYVQKRVYRIAELCLCIEESIQNYGVLFMYSLSIQKYGVMVMYRKVYRFTVFFLCREESLQNYRGLFVYETEYTELRSSAYV